MLQASVRRRSLLRCLSLALILLTACATALASADTADLLLHYDFDGAATARVSDRSGHGVDALFAGFDAAGDAPVPLAEGVSAGAQDRCFDNSSATGMGAEGRGGAVRSRRFVSGPLDSLTITGWFKTEGNVWLDHLARLTEARGRPNLSLMAVNGQLLFKLGESSFMSAAAYHQTSTWVFFAVSYDGTLPPTADNVRFYVGTTKVPVKLVNKGSLLPPLGSWQGTEAGSELTWGNGVAQEFLGDRPLDGCMDDLRFYGKGDGGGGALDSERLERVRQSALGSP